MFYSSKKVTTRKKHRCTGCIREFPPGTNMEKYAGFFEGEFVHGYTCTTCQSILEYFRDRFEDGYDAGDLASVAIAIEKAVLHTVRGERTATLEARPPTDTLRTGDGGTVTVADITALGDAGQILERTL
jgi:hypothetical protein